MSVTFCIGTGPVFTEVVVDDAGGVVVGVDPGVVVGVVGGTVVVVLTTVVFGPTVSRSWSLLRLASTAISATATIGMSVPTLSRMRCCRRRDAIAAARCATASRSAADGDGGVGS